MRRAFNNFRFIVDGDNFYGVSLGYDFCAEHEWGIDGIIDAFGINKKDTMGIDRRTITKSNVILKEGDGVCLLMTKPWNYERDTDKPIKSFFPHDVHSVGDITTAWDERDFFVATSNKDNFKYIKDLFENFEKLNIAICFLKSEVPAFSNASLSILIKDRLPKEVTDQMYHVDKGFSDLIDYEKEIGVTKLKEQAKKSGYKEDKYFLACSPRWIDYDDAVHREELKKKRGTKYDVLFWVNYSDDDDNYGWYTAEEIIKWLSTPKLKLSQIRQGNK